jgi:hypothetical protein
MLPGKNKASLTHFGPAAVRFEILPAPGIFFLMPIDVQELTMVKCV